MNSLGQKELSNHHSQSPSLMHITFTSSAWPTSRLMFASDAFYLAFLFPTKVCRILDSYGACCCVEILVPITWGGVTQGHSQTITSQSQSKEKFCACFLLNTDLIWFCSSIYLTSGKCHHEWNHERRETQIALGKEDSGKEVKQWLLLAVVSPLTRRVLRWHVALKF